MIKKENRIEHMLPELVEGGSLINAPFDSSHTAQGAAH